VTTKVNSQVQVDHRAAQSFKTLSADGNQDVEDTVNEMVRSEIERQGYRDVPTERAQWVWGDVSLLNQFLITSAPDSRWSVQQILRMPTSRNPSLSDFALASRRDEGQIDVGVSSFYERNFGPTVGILGLGYVNQLPGSVRVTELDEEGNRVPGDKEVERDLGNVWWAGVESKWVLSNSFSLSGAYRYFYKEPDHWKTYVEDSQSHQEAHLARMVVSYALVGERRYSIEKKWLLNFQVQSDLAGVNSDKLTSGSLEIQTYF
jgi:hypothetical protein